MLERQDTSSVDHWFDLEDSKVAFLLLLFFLHFCFLKQKEKRWNLSIWTPLYYRQYTYTLRHQNLHKAYFSKTDTSIVSTLIPVPLVSVIKRFNCTHSLPKAKKVKNSFCLFARYLFVIFLVDLSSVTMAAAIHVEDNAILKHGEQFADYLRKGLSDNWSQVRCLKQPYIQLPTCICKLSVLIIIKSLSII